MNETAQTHEASQQEGWIIAQHEWRRVSPKYVVIGIVFNLIMATLLAVAAAVALFVSEIPKPLIVAGGVACLVVLVVNTVLRIRRTRALGYALREDDLVCRRGIMFERVVAVPYGRLQQVDITRGPLLRALGLSNLKFVTAAATTDVVLPGLPAAEAERVRDHLIEVAETRRSGL